MLPDCFKYSDRVGDLSPEAVVDVKLETTWLGGLHVGADEEWCPFSKVVAALGLHEENAATTSRAPPKKRHTPNADLVLENPWLLDLLGDPSGGVPAGARAASSSSSSAEAQAEPDPLTPNEIEDVFDALHARRAEFATVAQSSDGFSRTVLGGRWTQQHRGVAHDSYRGQACTKQSKEWALAHGLPASATFSLAKYGVETCAVLVQYWTDKMNFLFRLSQGRTGRWPHKFSDADLSAFVEKADFAQLFGRVPRAVEQRAAALRAIKPV